MSMVRRLKCVRRLSGRADTLPSSRAQAQTWPGAKREGPLINSMECGREKAINAVAPFTQRSCQERPVQLSREANDTCLKHDARLAERSPCNLQDALCGSQGFDLELTARDSADATTKPCPIRASNPYSSAISAAEGDRSKMLSERPKCGDRQEQQRTDDQYRSEQQEAKCHRVVAQGPQPERARLLGSQDSPPTRSAR